MKKLRPNIERAKMATVFLWIMIAVLGVRIISELNQLFIIEKYVNGTATEATYETAEQADLFVLLAGSAYLLALIGCAIVFIMWFRRAYFNLHTLIPTGLRMTEGWAAGAWFIPVYNLWGPFTIASDLFSRTEGLLLKHDLTEPRPQQRQILGWWWALWIAGIILPSVRNRMVESVEPEVILNSCYVGIVSTLALMAAAYLAIRTIKVYNEMEELLPQIKDVGTDRSDDTDLLDSTF